MSTADLEDVPLDGTPQLGDRHRPLVLGHLEATSRLPQWQQRVREQRMGRQQRLAVGLLCVQRRPIRLAHLAALLLGRCVHALTPGLHVDILVALEVELVALVLVHRLVAAALRHRPLPPCGLLLLLLLLARGLARLAGELARCGLGWELALAAEVLAALGVVVELGGGLEVLALGPGCRRVGRALCPALL